MADIKNITIDGTTYDLKDAKAREDVSDLKGDLSAVSTGELDIDNATANTGYIVWKATGVVQEFSGVTTWAVSDLLRIPPNTVYISTNFNNGGTAASEAGFAIYDDNNQFIIGGKNVEELEILDTYKYIRMTNYSATSDHSGLYVHFAVGHMVSTDRVLSDSINEMFHVEVGENLYVGINSQGVVKAPLNGCKYKAFDVSDIEGQTVCISSKRLANPYSYFALIVDSENTLLYLLDVTTVTEISNFPIKIPSDAKYLYINYSASDDVCKAIRVKMSEKWEIENQGFASKTCYCFGDSITWYDGNAYTWGKFEGQTAIGYETYIAKAFGLIVKNMGWSGATAVQICELLRRQSLTDCDLLILTSGANDERHNTPLGVVLEAGSEFTRTTFCGAFQSAIEWALSRNPEMKIILCTPIQGWIYENGYDSTDYPDHPSGGDINEKWADAIRRIAAVYALPVCDWYTESGINLPTRDIYMNDPEPPTNKSYSLHPTYKGFERMSEILVSTIKKILPV